MRVKFMKNRYTWNDLDCIFVMYVVNRGYNDFLCLTGVQGCKCAGWSDLFFDSILLILAKFPFV